jgi:hypothetical protein
MTQALANELHATTIAIAHATRDRRTIKHRAAESNGSAI